MAHPYARLLQDRDVRVLWGGLTLSAVGSELYGVGAIWLAVGIAGAEGSYLATARFAAVLVASLGAGAFVDLVSRRFLLIGSDLVRALFSAVVVVAALADGLTLPVLILASAGLAAFGAVFQPALQSGLPRLFPHSARLRETNGLFDATARTAQVAGPFLAAALASVLPVIHLLSLNALSFLASAGAIARLGSRLDGAKDDRPRPTIWRRLARGVHAANGCGGAWPILLTTTVRAGGYALGFGIGVPLFFAGRAETGLGGIAAVALVLGAAAAGELLSNLAVVLIQPRDPWRFMFAGYATIGAGLALTAAAQSLPPSLLQVLLMAVLAFAMGVGGSMAGIQMLTFLGSRLDADDYAGVLRLRLVLVTGAAVVSTALGPILFEAFGIPGTVLASGLLMLAACAVGVLSKTNDRAEAPAGDPRD